METNRRTRRRVREEKREGGPNRCKALQLRHCKSLQGTATEDLIFSQSLRRFSRTFIQLLASLESLALLLLSVFFFSPYL